MEALQERTRGHVREGPPSRRITERQVVLVPESNRIASRCRRKGHGGRVDGAASPPLNDANAPWALILVTIVLHARLGLQELLHIAFRHGALPDELVLLLEQVHGLLAEEGLMQKDKEDTGALVRKAAALRIALESQNVILREVFEAQLDRLAILLHLPPHHEVHVLLVELEVLHCGTRLSGLNAGHVLEDDHARWLGQGSEVHRHVLEWLSGRFGPNVGVLEAVDVLDGMRLARKPNDQYIQGFHHRLALVVTADTAISTTRNCELRGVVVHVIRLEVCLDELLAHDVEVARENVLHVVAADEVLDCLHGTVRPRTKRPNPELASARFLHICQSQNLAVEISPLIP